MNISPQAQEAISKIRALRQTLVPATEKAVSKVLSKLPLQDLIDVTAVVNATVTDTKEGAR
jgi:hypothetical protein